MKKDDVDKFEIWQKDNMVLIDYRYRYSLHISVGELLPLILNGDSAIRLGTMLVNAGRIANGWKKIDEQ